jgi:dihydroorotate dehydrogenase (fumarate)
MDLSTNYLGLTLKNPLVPSASPLSKSLDMAKQLEDAGASALIMHSLFEEAVIAESKGMERFLLQQDTGFAEAEGGFLPNWNEFSTGLDQYLERLRHLKEALEIPVIASLNGTTAGGWIQHAQQLQAAGADALELNIYYIAADIQQSSTDIEQRYLEILKTVKSHITIPVTMKLSPHFTALGHVIQQFAAAGANGVGLFNRFYQPDINIEQLRPQASLHPSVSTDALLAIRWMALLYGRFDGVSFGITSGIHTAEDVIKALLAGADVVHLCSVLLKKGPQQLVILLRELQEWMERQGFDSVADVRGRVSALTVAHPAEFERANYVAVLDSYSFAPGVMV